MELYHKLEKHDDGLDIAGQSRHAYVVSIKYTPGLAKEFSLLGDKLEQHGWRVTYLLSQGYSWLMNPAPRDVYYVTRSVNTKQMLWDVLKYLTKNWVRIFQLFAVYPPNFICFYNTHPLNFAFAALARHTCPAGIRAIYLHEPFKPDKMSFGRLGALYFALGEFLQTISLRVTNCVIVPSPYARDLFLRRYPRFPGATYLAPILLPEREAMTTGPRKYVSLVGRINQGRGVDTFISLVNYAASLAETLEFIIVTASDITAALRNLSPAGRNLLQVINKPRISDDEIAEVVAQSIALFLPHKQVTQSGNVPVAFREGTPIIASNLPGFAQHIRHKENGYLVPCEATAEQLIQAINYVRKNLPHLSCNARASFEATFASKNWERYYEWLGSRLSAANTC